jgi:hypothetical protein
MVWAGRLEKLLKVINRLSCLALEVMLDGSAMLLVRVISLLVVIAFIIASSICDPLGHHFGPLLLPLALLLVSLPVALGGAPRLSPGTTFLSPWMNTTLTASSPEVCWVVMLSISFVVFG